jgi:hypothetical protein
LCSKVSQLAGSLHCYLFGVQSLWEVRAEEWIEGYLGCDLEVSLGTDVSEERSKPAKFARHVAARAYFQFGVRNYNKANKMVTRKWIRNLLEQPEFKDLRLAHKIDVIDEALALSFVPSRTWENVQDLVETEFWKDTVPHEREGPK